MYLYHIYQKKKKKTVYLTLAVALIKSDLMQMEAITTNKC